MLMLAKTCASSLEWDKSLFQRSGELTVFVQHSSQLLSFSVQIIPKSILLFILLGSTKYRVYGSGLAELLEFWTQYLVVFIPTLSSLASNPTIAYHERWAQTHILYNTTIWNLEVFDKVHSVLFDIKIPLSNPPVLEVKELLA